MSILSLIPVFFVLALVGPATWALGNVYRRNRGAREVTCPENGQFATIELDVRHALVAHSLGDMDQRVKMCSRRPEREGCDQACVR